MAAALLAPLAGLGGEAAWASTTSPTVQGSTTMDWSTGHWTVEVTGAGFTPAAAVHIEVDADWYGPVSTADVQASQRSWECDDAGLKPRCSWVGVNGRVEAALPLSPPGPCYLGTDYGTVVATDEATGLTATGRISWQCIG